MRSCTSQASYPSLVPRMFTLVEARRLSNEASVAVVVKRLEERAFHGNPYGSADLPLVRQDCFRWCCFADMVSEPFANDATFPVSQVLNSVPVPLGCLTVKDPALHRAGSVFSSHSGMGSRAPRVGHTTSSLSNPPKYERNLIGAQATKSVRTCRNYWRCCSFAIATSFLRSILVTPTPHARDECS